MREGQIIGYFSIGAVVYALFVLMTADGKSPLSRQFPSVFGAEETGPKPEETFIAPFAQAPPGYVPPSTLQEVQSLPVNDIPINQPHRTSDEIATWLMRVISESLDFSLEELDQILASPPATFTPAAQQQYREFAEAARFRENLSKGDFRLHSYVEETPFLLNKGVSNNTYSWLYEIQVMVSYLPRGVKSYEGTVPANQEFTITVQVGRYNDAKEEGIMIESWKSQPRLRKN